MTDERLDVAFHFTSDVDGARHLIIDAPDVDCSAWLVWVHEANEPNTPHRSRTFDRITVFGEPGNLLGYGDQREVWAAYVDRGESVVVEVDGRRRKLRSRLEYSPGDS